MLPLVTPIRLLTLALVISPLSAVGDDAHEQSPFREQLKLLTIPASTLPAGCTLAAGGKTASILGAAGNPSVSQNHEFIQRLACLGFSLGDGKKNMPAGIDAAIVIMYQDQKPTNEIGVYALVCKNADAATRLAKEIPQPPHGEIARKGKLLIRIWKDDGASQAAHQAVRDYFRQRGFE